jgi:peptidyl-tRNA hydrolase, PTH1 family
VKLIVGLGNPGPQYRGTRHNIGFAVADAVARRHQVAFESAPAEALMAKIHGLGPGVLVAKPLTFVNLSGQAVDELSRYFRIAIGDLLVVADDVSLPLGRLRARARGSDGGHNGLRSIIERLGTDEFARLRVGVGRGDPRRDLADHVLARFEPEEHAEVDSAVLRAADAVEMFAREDIAHVMNSFNRDESSAEDNGAGA